MARHRPGFSGNRTVQRELREILGSKMPLKEGISRRAEKSMDLRFSVGYAHIDSIVIQLQSTLRGAYAMKVLRMLGADARASPLFHVMEAIHSKNREERRNSVNNLRNDQKSLHIVACYSRYKDTRLQAIDLISDELTLVNISHDAKYLDARVGALENLASRCPGLTHTLALWNLGWHYPDESIRNYAVSQLCYDLHALARLTESHFADTRRAAVEKLAAEDNGLQHLREIATNCKHGDTRELARGLVERIETAMRDAIRAT